MTTAKTRQIIMIILFLMLSAGIAFLLYFVFFRQLPEQLNLQEPVIKGSQSELPGSNLAKPSDIIPGETAIPGLPTPGSGFNAPVQTITSSIIETEELNPSETQAIQLNSNGSDLNFYDKENGIFYKASPNGQIQELSDKVFFDVETVAWSANSTKGILEYPDGSNIYYNFQTKEQVTLPKNWSEFKFNPSGTQIAFKELNDNPDLQWISVANPDGSGRKTVEHMGINDDKVTISYSPNNEIIAYYAEPAGIGRSRLFFIGKNEENFKATVVDGYNVESQWNPSGKQLLYSSIQADTEYIPELWIVNAQGESIGQNRINLGLNTWADKCTFSSETVLYCAVPIGLDIGAGLEKSLSYSLEDEIYRIDLETGQKTLVAKTDTAASINQISVTKDESTVYFVDNNEKTLQKVQL